MTHYSSPDQLAPHHGPSDLKTLAQLARTRLAELLAGRPDLQGRVDQAVRALDRDMPGRNYHALPDILPGLAAGVAEFPAMIAAALLADCERRWHFARVPDSVRPEFIRQARRILALELPAFSNDAFLKDLSICLLLSFPCVAQVVEQTGAVPRSVLLSGGAGQALRMARYFAAAGLRAGPYFEIHTHTPMLDGFTPAGWDRCYGLIADLLHSRPDIMGMVGGSWFYDPALATITPRLAYLADTPIAGGAFRVRFGASQADRDLATATSASRRALVERGEYIPTRWLLIWPRAALLRWAADRVASGAA